MRSIVRWGVALALMCVAARAEEPAPAASPGRREVSPGRIVSPVRSLAKPEQSYALYVPAGYSAERKWPIVYVFDPGAQGLRPLALLQHAAEQHGYLLAASHNSRNGPWQVSQDAAVEMWDDTHRSLSIDDRRVYFAGFSGGARVSAALAESCRCARGVFLDGAGFNPAAPPTREPRFAVFAMAGLVDFNYGELVELDAQLEGLGFRHALRRFEGEHTWAPAAEWEDALAWSSLLEMKDGVRDRNEAVIASELARALERGRKLEETGEAVFALSEYRSAAVALTGLADTAALAARIGALGRDPSVRSGNEQEAAAIARQRALESEILGAMDALAGAGSERVTLQAETAQRIRRLRADLAAEKRPERRRVFQRAVGSVYVRAMEAGRQQLEAGGARSAKSTFTLAVEARPEQAGPHLALARCLGALGDQKAALRELERALATGLSAGRLAAAVEAEPQLAPLMRSEGYRKLLAGEAAERRAP